jgi:hypothetical protein
MRLPLNNLLVIIVHSTVNSAPPCISLTHFEPSWSVRSSTRNRYHISCSDSSFDPLIQQPLMVCSWHLHIPPLPLSWPMPWRPLSAICF